MKDSGLASIITPSYNTAGYIPETIESVLVQTYPNWELIIVDDCSTDNTDEIVTQYFVKDARIRYIRNKKNSGAAYSRNRALREAQGRWVAFLDSDDLWEPEKLEKQIRFMEENNYAFSYTNYLEIDKDSKTTGKIVSGPKRITKIGMFAFCWPGCLTVMYDVQKVGLVQIANIKKNNDYAMWLKACKRADCYLLDDCLARYRRGRNGSISTHGYITLIKWHYKLFHEAEKMNIFFSVLIAGANLVCGVYKKIKYVKRTHNW
ncbi:MAG: glycosyltransferase family 2 protein [Prevotella sp.]|nr:glycosyltransferase family 2 protein [Prevotella sp.]